MWEIDIFLFVLYLKNTCDKILMNTRDPRCSGKGRNTVGRVAIVGFGSAGYHAARALSIRCPGEEIHVYSTTDDGPSNPMLTTYYASGRIAREALFPFGSREQVVRELGIRLFANTPAGAQSSAVIYSLIETAKANGLDPYRYLLWVLRNAPQLSETDEAWAEKLLPANAPEECYMPHK